MSRKSGKFIVGSAGVAGLALLGVVSFGGAADSRAPADAPAAVAVSHVDTAARAPIAATSAGRPAGPSIAAPVSQAATGICGWPYNQPSCGDASGATATARQIRMIAIGRDAPRSVPVPESVEEAANRSIVLSAQPVVMGEGLAVLPPARPMSLGGVSPDAVVEATGSVISAAPRPQRRRVVQSRRPRENYQDSRRLVQIEQLPASLFGWLSASSF